MALRVADGPRAGAGKCVVATRATAAHGKRRAGARAEEALVLEALESGVHRAHRQLAPRALGEVVAHGKSVSIVAEANDSEEGRELEGSERRS